MGGLSGLFWGAAAAAAYPYTAYPAWVALRARCWPRPVLREGPASERSGVSVVLVARDEAANVARRVHEFARAIGRHGLDGEILVVSDGSTDGTAAAARIAAAATPGVPVSVIERPEPAGKAAALSAGCAAASRPIVALADARQTWAPDALVRLLENFHDPEVAAASGELMVESAPGLLAGVGLYWRFEKWLRQTESLAGSCVGVTGAISAVRREKFRPVPPGTVLDDVYWPLAAALDGGRVVFDGRAHAFDRLPDRVSAEFRRKVRTLAGNYQLVVRLPEVVRPWRNPIGFEFVSHKLARLVVPWAVLVTVAAAVALGGPLYHALFLLQVAGLLVAVAGLVPAVATRSRLAAAAGSFLVLNAAAWVAFWVWASGRTSRSWNRTAYAPGARSQVAESLQGAAS